MKKIAIIIILIGLGLTIFTAITVFTKEKIVDMGHMEITANMPHHYYWSPYVGIAVMAVGGLFFLLSSRK